MKSQIKPLPDWRTLAPDDYAGLFEVDAPAYWRLTAHHWHNSDFHLQLRLPAFASFPPPPHEPPAITLL